MNSKTLSPRVIELLIGILATAMIVAGLGIYALNEPPRIAAAQSSQLAADLDAAMSLYAANCAVCHGIAAEGIGATPPLDNPALREADAATLEKTISRGLYGAAMPAWNLSDGGPMSDYQVGQMVSLIQWGDWQAVQERVVNLGLAPLVPFTTQADPAILETLKTLPDGETLAAGVTLYAGQCVACHGADGLGSALAPALNDPAVREKTAEEIERIIRLGVPGTRMASWEKSLDDAQIAAAVTLIARWEEVPAGAIPAPNNPIPVTEESLALGQTLFANNCANCHGPEGQGSQRAPALNVRSFLTGANDQAIEQIITLGVPGTAMPVWGDRLTSAEIQAIVGFIRSWEPTAPEVAVAARMQGPWWQGAGGATVSAAAPAEAAGRAAAAAPAWYESLDWRAWALLGGAALLAAALLAAGLRGLRRLPPTGEQLDIRVEKSGQ